MDDKPNFRVVPKSDDQPNEEPALKSPEPVAKAQTPSGLSATAEAAPDKAAPPRRKRSLTRLILFAALPIALIIGGYFYVTGGQIMSTDNAYIQADMVGITTDVSGIVDRIDVHDNQHVKAGDVLFSLQQDKFRIALDGAKAQLGVQRNQIANLKASYKQAQAEVTQAEADVPYYQSQFDRQRTLAANGSGSQSAFDEAKQNLNAANQKVDVAKAQAGTILAQLGGNIDQPVEDNPLYLQAKAQVDNAQRELDHSVVKAPFDGIVTNVNSLQVGSYLQASTQAFALVSATKLWIDASPKETELTYVKSGEDVTIYVDTYPGVVWKGKVQSISPASGSSFSLLPAQNTTGNWVKVVQRIPMRISIDDTNGKPPLRVGMSTVVEVDTGHARGLPDFINHLLGLKHDKT